MLGGTINVIIICGGRLDGKLAARAPGNVKALLKVGEASMLEKAVSAVEHYYQAQTEPRIDEVAIVGGEEIKQFVLSRQSHLSINYVPEGISGIDNIYEAIRQFTRAIPVLVISPDLPFISSDCINDFTSKLEPTDEIVVATITKDEFLKSFPGAKNKFEKIKGEAQTLASVFYFRPNAFITNKPFFEDIFRLRKNPFKLALMLGFDLILKIIFGWATISNLEHRASQLCGCNVRTIRCSHPELAFDIDNVENYDFAIEHLKSKEN